MTWLLIVVLFATLLIAGLVFLWARVLSSPQVQGAVCGSCGYSVQGIQTFECPECGADLREVGIKTPQPAGGVTPLTFMFAWSLLYGVTALILGAIAVATGPQQISGRFEQTLTPVSAKHPYGVEVSWRWRGMGRQLGRTGNSISTGVQQQGGPTVLVLTYGHLQPHVELDAITLVVRSSSSPTQLTSHSLDLASDGSSFQYIAASGQSVQMNQPLDAAAVKQWFVDVGVKTDPATVGAEADDLVVMVKGLIGRQSPIVLKQFRSGGHGSSWAGGPTSGWLALVIVTGLTIWLAGIVIYFRKRRQTNG